MAGQEQLDQNGRTVLGGVSPASGSTTLPAFQLGAASTDATTGLSYAPQVVQLQTPTSATGHVVIDANTIATYASAYIGLTPAASCTDLAILNGSASKVIRVMRVVVSAITSAATGATLDLVLAVRSAANTAGTAVTAAAIVPFDSNDAAATATLTAYSANPTTGTLVGNVYVTKFQQTLGTATATDFPSNLPFQAQWGMTDSKPIVLRGAAQGLAINFNGSSFAAGASVDLFVEWTEAAS